MMDARSASPLSKIDLPRILAPETGRSAEMEAVWQFILAEDAKLPDQTGMSLPEQRKIAALRNRRWNDSAPTDASVERFNMPGLSDAPEFACDLYTPADAKPGCLVYLHGGGWANGSIDSHTRIPATLAKTLGLRVLNVDYRLAPENPYPAGLQDSIAALRWAFAQAASNSDFNGPVVISGDSAGGNLAMAAMLHEARASRRLPDCALLFYGVYGCDFDTPSYRRFGAGYGLARAGMEKFIDWYAPGGEGPDAPRFDLLVSPVQAPEATLARLPPIYMNAAGLDPLLCDTLAMAQRLEEAGVRYDVNVHEGVHHGFMQITERLSEARRAYDLAKDFFDAVTG